LRQDVATDRRAFSTEIRKASRSHASNSPCRARIWISERPGQTEDYYPEDKEYLLEFEPEVQHYTVVAGSNAILAKGSQHD
jgi:hypothetical protein